ncbi:MAG: glycosyltransferase family 4 protein [Alphaproteobacteria bacterium]
MTKILFIDDGVEFDSKIFREKPLGGAEVAFVNLVESLAKTGFEVVVYNNCINQGKINSVFWKKIDKNLFKETFDTLVINRGDKYLDFKKECKNRIFWIHNPAKYLLKFRYLSKLFFNNTKIVFSSKYHLKTYPWWAPAEEKIVIPYGIDNNLLKKKKTNYLKNKHAIFTSNPMRGLDWVLDNWEKEIHPACKNSKLFIYAGFQTYGKFGKKHSKNIKKILKKANSLKDKGVVLNQPVKRKELFNRIKKSRVFIYKGSEDETFCMAVAESLVSGVPAVVGDYGCLNERVINNKTGFVCKNDVEFYSNTINLLKDDDLWKRMSKECQEKKNYYSWNEVAEKWKKILI